jgi:hypothetical protein
MQPSRYVICYFLYFFINDLSFPLVSFDLAGPFFVFSVNVRGRPRGCWRNCGQRPGMQPSRCVDFDFSLVFDDPVCFLRGSVLHVFPARGFTGEGFRWYAFE